VAPGTERATRNSADAADRAARIRKLPVTALLDEAVRLYGRRPAMDFLGRRWTYAKLGRAVDRAARGLQAIGVEKGVRVGLCLPNTPYSVIFFFAVLRAGGVVVNFSPLYVERELRHQIRDSGTTVMIVPDLALIHGKVRAVAAEAGLRHIVVCPMEGVLPFAKAALFRVLRRKDRAAVPRDALHVSYARLLAASGPLAPVSIAPDDVAVLQYTGGTTGTPKGAMLTHANLTANCQQVWLHSDVLRPGVERFLVVLPLFHVFALTACMTLPVMIGAELVLLPRFELKQVLATIRRRRPTVVNGVPTIFNAINNAADAANLDLSAVRFCVSGGAPLPGEVRERFERLTGCPLLEGYGLSETSPVVCLNPPDAVRQGSVGLPVPGTVVEIRDPAEPSRVLDVGERGEVCVRGPQVMAGYWQRPEETASVIFDGALRTGDIGYRDADGYVFLVDRIKDVILCGGYNVYPRVLEDALYEHPSVAEATVIGVPDAYRGQAPKAFVVLRAGASATPEDLRAHLAGYVSKIEMPREIEIRESLPKTLVGKLSKKELVAEELRAAAGGGAT
jgi:long-chain acyl-CoA synthetase